MKERETRRRIKSADLKKKQSWYVSSFSKSSISIEK